MRVRDQKTYTMREDINVAVGGDTTTNTYAPKLLSPTPLRSCRGCPHKNKHTHKGEAKGCGVLLSYQEPCFVLDSLKRRWPLVQVTFSSAGDVVDMKEAER